MTGRFCERGPCRMKWNHFGVCLMLLLPSPALAQGARLQLDFLDRLSSQASETVDITVDPAMLQQAMGVVSGNQANDERFKALVAGLKGMYVKVFEFDREGVYTDADVERVRGQLKSPWSRLVSVQSRKDRELVEVYMWRDTKDPGGIAVVVAEPKELVIVNIVGRIDLQMLGALQGQFGIPFGIPGLSGGAPPAPKPDPKPNPQPQPR